MKFPQYQTPVTFLLLCLLALLLTGAATKPQISAWVIRWHIDRPEKISTVCKEAEGNFTSLLVQARGRADAYYQSEIVPRAEELAATPADFDPLATLLDKCSSQKTQAWLNVYYLWTGDELPKDLSHPAQPENPWILKDNSGRKVTQYSKLEQTQNWIEGTYADPASAAYQQLFIKVVGEIVSTYQLDGIHLDFLRYPGAAFGYGGELAAEFHRQWNFDPRFLPAELSKNDLISWYDGSMAQNEQLLVTGALFWHEMRADKVTDLVRRVRQKMDETNPQLMLSAAVFPDYLDAYLKKGQDWQQWATEGLVDELYPMAYFGGRERVTRQLDHFTQAVGDTKVKIWAGLGAYIKTATEIKDETLAITPLDLEGISLFSLGHLQKKKGRIPPYTKAVIQSFSQSETVTDSNNITKADDASLTIIGNFQHIVRNGNTAPKQADPIILERIKSFSAASQSAIPQLINTMKETVVQTPAWVDMHGIFRFVHPFDSAEKKQVQKELCQQARKKMMEGDSMKKVSKQFSQAGSRHFSSVLPRLFLSQDRKRDKELARLQPGQVSRIFEEDNGYWCYKISKEGQAEMKNFSEISWPARRILFRQQILNSRNY